MNPAVAILALPAVLLAVALPAGVGQGHDPYDDVCTLEEFRELEVDVRGLASRLRPSVVMLRLGGRLGGATGTGVVLSPDGLVATCGHVGGRAGRRVTATLSDGTQLSGRTLGQAEVGPLDCGLVQLDAGGRSLETAPLGTSSDLAPGDWVLAMGYTHGPPDRDRPALVRVGRVLRCTPDELLFDAPIDAGDSGGPSFNLRGEVVGINSRCGGPSWQNAATPVDRLRERMWQFRDSVDESMTMLDFEDSPDPGVRTNFERGGSQNGRMQVQRSLPLEDVVSRARASMVRVLDGRSTRCYATVVDADGLAVTKRSQLPDGWQSGEVGIEAADGSRLSAHVVGSDGPLDLAVLRIEACAVPAIRWNSGVAIGPGKVLLSPRLGVGAPALGFAAIERRESTPDLSSGPYLGVRTDDAGKDDLDGLGLERALRVDEVVPGSGAERAGVRVGDLLTALDGAALADRTALRRLIVQRASGDRVRLSLVRDGAAMELDAELGRRQQDGRPEARRGNTTTPISAVSTGFGEVVAHDAIVWPEQCGGPVVDLDGNAVALNIARYDRTATHALDAKTVMNAVRRILDDSQRAPTRPAAAPPPADR